MLLLLLLLLLLLVAFAGCRQLDADVDPVPHLQGPRCDGQGAGPSPCAQLPVLVSSVPSVFLTITPPCTTPCPSIIAFPLSLSLSHSLSLLCVVGYGLREQAVAEVDALFDATRTPTADGYRNLSYILKARSVWAPCSPVRVHRSPSSSTFQHAADNPCG